MDRTCIKVDDPGPAKKVLEYEVHWLQKIYAMNIQNVSGKMNEKTFYNITVCKLWKFIYNSAVNSNT